jgi:thioredoxin reductase
MRSTYSIKNVLSFFQVYKCDLVLLAMGFLGPEKYISSELDLALDPRSNYQTPSGYYHTSLPKVFAAGGTVHLLFVLYVTFLLEICCSGNNYLNVNS